MSAPQYDQKCECVDLPTLALIRHKPTNKLIDVRKRLNQITWRRMIKWRNLIMADRYRDGPRYLCPVCSTPLYLLSTKNHKLYFQHMPTKTKCQLKEKGTSSREVIRELIYGKRKESQKHKDLIRLIAGSLVADESFKNIQTDATVKDTNNPKQRRFPDIQADFNGEKIVFEAQVSSTFLDVIDARRHFYQQNHMKLFWVFPSFEQTDRRIAEDDIISQNGGYAIVVDHETFEQSLIAKTFIVRAHHYNSSANKWEESQISFLEFWNQTEVLSKHSEETELSKQSMNLKDLCSDFAGLFPNDDKNKLESLSNYLKRQNIVFPKNRFLEDNWFPNFVDIGIETHLRRMVQVIETAHSGNPFGYAFTQKPFLQIANSLHENDQFALFVYGSILKLKDQKYALKELNQSANWRRKIPNIRKNWNYFKTQSRLSDFERKVLDHFYPEYSKFHGIDGLPF